MNPHYKCWLCDSEYDYEDIFGIYWCWECFDSRRGEDDE